MKNIRCCCRRLCPWKLLGALVAFLILLSCLSDASAQKTESAAADALEPPTANNWTVAAAAPSLFRAAHEAPRLHVAVMSVPLWGHFKPLWAIAEELAFRGHTVSVFVEEVSWCRTILEHSRWTSPSTVMDGKLRYFSEKEAVLDAALDIHCVVVPRHSEVFGAETFQPMTRAGSSVTLSFVRLFHDLMAHHALSLGEYVTAAQAVHASHPLTTVLCDIVTYACTSTARKMGLPVVHSFPFTTQLSVGLHPLLPAVGLGHPRHMSLVQRTQNFAFKLLSLATAGHIVRVLNHVRAEHGIAPYRDPYDVAGMYAPLITPTVWGLDIPQPLCPNVHAVGPLNTRDQRRPYRRHDLAPALANFMDTCTQGVLYVNWGTLAAPSAAMEATLMEGLAAAAPYCVVWKRRAAPAGVADDDQLRSLSDRFYVTSWLASPMAVLRHPNTLAFVSHCGDASVLESVEAAVPIIGFPLFADQADVCKRVVESGVGVQVTQTKTFAAAEVKSAVVAITRTRSQRRRRLLELQAIAAAAGGPARAADILETRQYNLLLSRPTQLEQCGDLGASLRTDVVLAAWVFTLLVTSMLWCGALRCARRCWRGVCTTLPSQSLVAMRRSPQVSAASEGHRVRVVSRAYKKYKQL